MLRIRLLKEETQLINLEKNLDNQELVRKIAIEAEQAFVHESPVDTGLLRANWFVSVEGGDKRTFDRKTHQPSQVPFKQPTLWVLNNINYVQYANVTSYRPMFIEKALNLIRDRIARIRL